MPQITEGLRLLHTRFMRALLHWRHLSDKVNAITATQQECSVPANLRQRLLPEDGKGKARADIQIEGALRDDRNDSTPDFWKHTDATRQFQQACQSLHILASYPTFHHCSGP